MVTFVIDVIMVVLLPRLPVPAVAMVTLVTFVTMTYCYQGYQCFCLCCGYLLQMLPGKDMPCLHATIAILRTVTVLQHTFCNKQCCTLAVTTLLQHITLLQVHVVHTKL